MVAERSRLVTVLSHSLTKQSLCLQTTLARKQAPGPSSTYGATACRTATTKLKLDNMPWPRVLSPHPHPSVKLGPQAAQQAQGRVHLLQLLCLTHLGIIQLHMLAGLLLFLSLKCTVADGCTCLADEAAERWEGVQDVGEVQADAGIILRHAVVQHVGRVGQEEGPGLKGHDAVWPDVDRPLDVAIPAAVAKDNRHGARARSVSSDMSGQSV